MRLAGPDDDAALRSLLRRSVIPGAVRVAFTREPSFAAGEGLAAADDITVVLVRDGAADAMGRCAVRALHRNGVVRRLGYLGELRFDPAQPTSVRAMRAGYAMLADAAMRVGVEGFFTSIAEDNVRARRVLENGGRLGLPEYRPLCRLGTLLAPVARRAARAGAPDEARGDDTERAELTQFLARHASAAHLTLTWDDARWTALARHGITPADFAVVRRGGRIVAAAAVWDQRAFRQTVVDGYTGALAYARPLLNAARALRALPPLPAAGSVLAQAAVLGVSVEDEGDWPSLWGALRARAAARGVAWLTLARDRRDPSLVLLRRLLRPREYHTTLYEVVWHDRPTRSDPWDARLFHPEVALL